MVSEPSVLERLIQTSKNRSLILNAFVQFALDLDTMSVTPITQKVWVKGSAPGKKRKKKRPRPTFEKLGDVEL